MRTGDGGGPDRLAPVTPLFGPRGGAAVPADAEPVEEPLAEQWHPTWRSDPAPGPGRLPDGLPTRTSRARPVFFTVDDAEDVDDAGDEHAGDEHGGDEHGVDAASTPDLDGAERMLLRKLTARQLSVSEARSLLRTQELASDAVEQLIAVFLDRGYLDDGRLAEQLVHAGSERKGQGRRAIAQTLSARGVPRDVADAALAVLPDDDADRALEFARTKARQLRHLDETTALRRLMGQLSRRGYPGSVASAAARTALSENSSGGGVRFS
ncbi:regulatory protein RecX [Microbacterium caowuchunii]|uniref:regulatory protein RecX n=1 Tax=Microbacterium caowuchunii TaxID=2614638 RepID=UPI001248223B|nr:regulatory protein RecX [Microbacterium caowuchunii]QEW00414.1 regulatory protein RecX [Microbacterium caowuchunii]